MAASTAVNGLRVKKLHTQVGHKIRFFLSFGEQSKLRCRTGDCCSRVSFLLQPLLNRFVMAVSALEPLAVQESLGDEVSSAVDELVAHLSENAAIAAGLKDSLKGRLLQLKRESVRQALKRHCLRWFPDDSAAWKVLDHAYGLRSELLHEGRPTDLDLLLAEQTETISNYLRAFCEKEFGQPLRAPVHAL